MSVFDNDATTVKNIPIESLKQSEFIAAINLKNKRDQIRAELSNPNLSDQEVDNIIYLRENPIQPAQLSQGTYKKDSRKERENAVKMNQQINSYFLRTTPAMSDEFAYNNPQAIQYAYRTNALSLPVATVAGSAAVATAPATIQFFGIPEVQGTLRLGFGIQGAKNLASEEGVKKTARLFRNKEYVEGTKSAAGDLLDATMVYPLARTYYNLSKQNLAGIGRDVQNFRTVYKNIKPVQKKVIEPTKQYNQIPQSSPIIFSNPEEYPEDLFYSMKIPASGNQYETIDGQFSVSKNDLGILYFLLGDNYKLGTAPKPDGGVFPIAYQDIVPETDDYYNDVIRNLIKNKEKQPPSFVRRYIPLDYYTEADGKVIKNNKYKDIGGIYDPTTNISHVNAEMYPQEEGIKMQDSYQKEVHERDSHGSENFLTIIETVPYRNLTELGLFNKYKNLFKNKYSQRWMELRATLNEVRAGLYRKGKLSYDKDNKKMIISKDITDQQIWETIRRTSEYGQDYYNVYNHLLNKGMEGFKERAELTKQIRRLLQYSPIIAGGALISND